ncbi:hypothetical protein XENTR_v10024867 [Xenopus tropicalis]|uniref:Fibrinogen-like protein 1-like protein n=1 Tax=Xenopus tropicalis TaxID=8364 RepID=A0A1B8Y2S8_XENTR|nr:fibrinogen-like protein 1-like protein [Xenopus tropicalis]KAE8581639.1 hypothetical protein XENTR_v10024867 [Xenopus tropicalis]
MPFFTMWPLCFFVLLGALHVGRTEEPNTNNIYGIENIHMVQNFNDILNLKDLQRRAVFYTRDCEELYQLGHTKSGLYVIRPEGSPKLVVQCYMHDCNGWTVIQRNSFNTEITWSTAWTTYKYGFGDIESDHWLGNKYIQLLATQKWNKVRIILTDSKNKLQYAEYDSFYLKEEKDKYQLRLGAYSGTAGDSLSNGTLKNMHDNMRFSTHDDDNDRSHNTECADEYGGGWWYDSCYVAQLNRKNGIHWQTLCDHNCKASLIIIKPAHMYCHRA